DRAAGGRPRPAAPGLQHARAGRPGALRAGAGPGPGAVRARPVRRPGERPAGAPGTRSVGDRPAAVGVRRRLGGSGTVRAAHDPARAGRAGGPRREPVRAAAGAVHRAGAGRWATAARRPGQRPRGRPAAGPVPDRAAALGVPGL
ncbi:MAG: hypothetical protein AVDCRST_MAG41-2249, partial [uncultured Corynebacteriales bacterium]